MRYAKMPGRLAGLGSEKWAIHIEGKRRAALGEPLIFLSIGEPDAPPPAAIMDVAEKQMRAGRTRYSSSRGEPSSTWRSNPCVSIFKKVRSMFAPSRKSSSRITSTVSIPTTRASGSNLSA